jgi:nucleotide-binding universal stress UspA family protein
MRAPYSPSVVVGIDGSRAAGNAALWAVDEAVSRDIPLRLVYAIDSTDNSDTVMQGAARNLAAAGGDLLGPTSSAALHYTDCSLLICDRRQRL